MSVNKRVVQATPDKGWSILADGWTYALWVVGASRIREVDDSWLAEERAALGYARIRRSTGGLLR